MQVIADYTVIRNETEFSQNFEPFDGPGFYLRASNTLLVVPRRPYDDATIENVWHREQPEGTLYEVHVFYCNFRDTMYAASAVAPVRLDKR